MTNRTITFTPEGRVELERHERSPAPLKPSEVLLKNRFSLVSAGTELACLAGTESWFPRPGTPGYISVAEVLEAGDEAPGLRPGQQVFTWGPHAEFFSVDTRNRYGGLCLPVPEGLHGSSACFTRMASIAMTALRVSSIELGDVVLVTGLGQVGNFAAQLAALQGATVVGVDLSARRRQAALDCGIPHVVDAGAPDWKEQVRRLAGRDGVAAHIEATGLASVAADGISLVGQRGEMLQLGSPRAAFQVDLADYLRRIHLPPFVEAKGALEWRYPTFRDEFNKHSIERNSEIILQLLLQGRLKVAPLLTHTLPPSRAAEAYAGLRDDKDNYLGVVFDWSL